LFQKLDISQDLVSYALPAMNKHSQNDMLFDRSKARKLTQEEYKDSDKILAWMGLPFTSSTSVEDFIKLMEIK